LIDSITSAEHVLHTTEFILRTVHPKSLFPIVVQIGFAKTSYTVGEGDKSVLVCAKLIAGTITTPVSVTLVTMETVSARGMFSE